MSELTSVDLKILEFINDKESADISTLKSKFPRIDSLEYRIKIMSTQEHGEFSHIPLPNSSYILQKYDIVGTGVHKTYKPLGIYEMTDFGRKYLQDCKKELSKNKKELWLKNAWIPILVSFATNLLIFGAKQLWPLILKLVSSYL